MSKQKTKEEIRHHKNAIITGLSEFMDSLIESADSKDAKRADLISYWLKDFQQYLSQEKEFDASKIKSYKRGDVIKINLGFRVGSEQGGLRYAVVLDKDNKHNAKTITVIPLTSLKENKVVYDRDIPLGRELYNRLKAKYDSAFEELIRKRGECEEAFAKTTVTIGALRKLAPEGTPPAYEIQEAIDQLQEILNLQAEDLKQLEEEEKTLEKIKSELHKMKDGSIAKIEQITTISKQRIYDPKRSGDVLAGIRFSDTAMDKINEKIKELYIF